MSPSDVLSKALRYRPYWGTSGGITVSGGEPLLQLDFLIELFSLAKAAGVHTCLDTAAGPYVDCGQWHDRFCTLMDNTDLVLLDIKHIDSTVHRQLTGFGNDNVLKCAQFLSDIGKPVWIRHVLVPGVNSDEPSLRRLSKFIDTLKNVKKVEVLPYHTFGVAKWKALGLRYALEECQPPTDGQLETANAILVKAHLNIGNL